MFYQVLLLTGNCRRLLETNIVELSLRFKINNFSDLEDNPDI